MFRLEYLKKDAKFHWYSFIYRRFGEHLPDSLALKLLYYIRTGNALDLKKPAKFTEKIQWLKLHNRNQIYSIMVDKYRAKNWVGERIGFEYVIPTIAVWEDPNDIDFNVLPEQFVLKCNHNAGIGLCVCKDKSILNQNKVRNELAKGLRDDYYSHSREWAYKNVKRCVIAEEYINDPKTSIIESDNSQGLIDYKFYCFNGEPKFLYVSYANIINGKKHDLLSFKNLDWSPTPFFRKDHEALPDSINKPENFEKMIEIARKLSQDEPFVRVDLYNISGKIYFSELTLYPGSGLAPFYPPEWERKIGSWIDLSLRK